MRRCLALAVLVIAAHPLLLAQDQPEAGARTVTTRIAPVYPELARRLNLEGIVKLRVIVAPDGTAKTAQVLGGNPVLAKAAQDAVSRWKWAPAPRETQELVELRFHPK
jgi:TonB family protein